MDYKYLTKKLPKLEKRSDHQFWFISLLLLILLLQSIALVVNHNKERTILVPLQFKEAIWVNRDGVSKNYLEAMGRYFALSFLNLTPESVDNQLAYLLKWVSPQSYGDIRSQFITLRDQFNADKFSTSFFVQAIDVDVGSLTVIVTGLLETHVGKKQVTEQLIHFRCRFSYENGQLLIQEMGALDENLD